MTKECSSCGEMKAFDKFYAERRAKNGLRSECKACVLAANQKWRNKSAGYLKEKRRIYDKTYNEKHPERRRASARDFARRNAENFKEYRKKFYEENRHLYASWDAVRKEFLRLATPAWANLKYIKLWYQHALNESKRVGKKCHVDHIVPIRSKLVCGLHNEFNLQVLDKLENLSKGNRRWPQMP